MAEHDFHHNENLFKKRNMELVSTNGKKGYFSSTSDFELKLKNAIQNDLDNSISFLYSVCNYREEALDVIKKEFPDYLDYANKKFSTVYRLPYEHEDLDVKEEVVQEEVKKEKEKNLPPQKVGSV